MQHYHYVRCLYMHSLPTQDPTDQQRPPTLPAAE